MFDDICGRSAEIEGVKNSSFANTTTSCEYMVDVTRTVQYYPSGALEREKWKRAGRLHRDSDLPASIYYQEDGSIARQDWYQNAQLHRNSDRPATIGYRADGSIGWQGWYRNDQLHRDADLPAVIGYRTDGTILSRWYVHGKYQREAKEYPEPALEDLVKPAYAR